MTCLRIEYLDFAHTRANPLASSNGFTRPYVSMITALHRVLFACRNDRTDYWTHSYYQNEIIKKNENPSFATLT